MANDSAKSLPTAPYTPLATLTGFIAKVKESVLPPRIDPKLARQLSGGNGGALISALKFLDLIEADTTVNDRLRSLVKSYQTESWKSEFGAVINEAFSEIIGDLDLTTATASMLEERFRTKTSASGQVLEKGIRFYLAAMNEVGAQVSPHITAPKTRTVGASPRRNGKGTGKKVGNEPGSVAPQDVPPANTKILRLQVPGKDDVKFYIPEDLAADDWIFLKPIFEAYINRMLNITSDTGAKKEK